MSLFQSTYYRTHRAGQLRLKHVGQQVVVSGFVQSIRRYKKHAFIELREETGWVQVFCPIELFPEGLREESAIRLEGTVAQRHQPHPNLAQCPTGEIEIQLQVATPLNVSEPLPFTRFEEPLESEAMRNKPLMMRWGAGEILRKRAAIVRAMRTLLEAHEFVEVETPILVRNTPGGANPFLVPFGEEQGYALAQSPQIWKQLLVCGGLERYYQLAHCFRNEGSRPERQPEFSQFEIEMAFVTAHEVQAVMEEVVRVGAGAVGVNLNNPFPRLSYAQALALYGSEKPHLGNPLTIQSTPAEGAARFEMGTACVELPEPLTRQEEKQYLGALWKSVGEQGEVVVSGRTLTLQGPLEPIQLALGAFIREIATQRHLIASGVYPVWVERMPMFECHEGQMEPAHHPFTRPAQESMQSWQHMPMEAVAEAFDLVINGYEIGGGSMRIHEAPLQEEIFAALGWNAQESEEHFKPLLEALRRGAPPHGGMALGVERLVCVLLELPNIRSVMAFPKTHTGQCLLTKALY